MHSELRLRFPIKYISNIYHTGFPIFKRRKLSQQILKIIFKFETFKSKVRSTHCVALKCKKKERVVKLNVMPGFRNIIAVLLNDWKDSLFSVKRLCNLRSRVALSSLGFVSLKKSKCYYSTKDTTSESLDSV